MTFFSQARRTCGTTHLIRLCTILHVTCFGLLSNFKDWSMEMLILVNSVLLFNTILESCKVWHQMSVVLEEKRECLWQSSFLYDQNGNRNLCREPSKHHSFKVWFQLANYFYRWRLIFEKFTDDGLMPIDGKSPNKPKQVS